MKLSTELPNWQDQSVLQSVPATSGIFCIGFSEGQPYLGKSANLRRRLLRILRPPIGSSYRLTLYKIARSVQYQITGSRFESDWLLYQIARHYRPEDYRNYLKLKPPTFIKVLLNNRYPRTCLTKRLTRSKGLFYGPFSSRSAAEQFQNEFLDLFLVRRCTENLDPSPDHPGCVYGELELCLRPCQTACSDADYLQEVRRVQQFLQSDGDTLLKQAQTARDRDSAAMEFESAARHHDLLNKTRAALRSRGELSREIRNLNGSILQCSSIDSCIEITFLYKGSLQPSICLPCNDKLLTRIRELQKETSWAEAKPAEKMDHLALLQRWHSSSFRQGEYVPFKDLDHPPHRKIVNAARRIVGNKSSQPGLL